MSGAAALDYDIRGATEWGSRAVTLAEQLGEPELLAMALNLLGVAELGAGIDGAAEKLQRGLSLAVAHELEEAIARSRQNIACTYMLHCEWAAADAEVAALEAFVAERDLDVIWTYTCGWRAWEELERGHWQEAPKHAHYVLDRPGVGPPTRLVPVAIARAEARWLGGEPAAVATETDHALALLSDRPRPWALGRLAVWRHRAGIDPGRSLHVPAPFEAELGGDPVRAARLWTELECPYEAALAGATADDEAVDVLRLLARGATDLEISERLFISPKTVNHHVSAILRALNVRNRTEASAEAGRIGLV